MMSHEDRWQEFLATRDPQLRAALAAQYSPLVGYVIRGMTVIPPALVSREDIVGYGTIGLMQAIDRYDPSRGVTFQTYAMQRIRWAIIDALRSMNPLSRADTAKVRTMEQAIDRLTQQKQRHPTEAELADELGVAQEEVERTLATSTMAFVSLERPVGSDPSEGNSLRDLLEDDNADEPGDVCERKELRRLLAEGIRQLPESSRVVLSLCYVEELTPQEVAEVLGVSRSRVYQLRDRAVKQLRRWLQCALEGRHAAPLVA